MEIKRLLFLAVIILQFTAATFSAHSQSRNPYLIVLGTAQDGGYPHAGCNKECCRKYYDGKEPKHLVSCLAIIDPISGERFLFDCTPDFPAQLHLLDSIFPSSKVMDGIFLTHAHIGHYAGLMYLGREAMNTTDVKVYAMPDMQHYLRTNGPWSLLVQLKNITLMPLAADSTIRLNERISVTPFSVPHRHEFTQAVGYRISAGGKSVIFIPDIDKWQQWRTDVVKLIKDNDLLFLDGTFYDENEIPGRDMSAIPHPFIMESMQLFSSLSKEDRAKIYFIHLNHSNPAILAGSDAQQQIEKKGFNVAREEMMLEL